MALSNRVESVIGDLANNRLSVTVAHEVRGRVVRRKTSSTAAVTRHGMLPHIVGVVPVPRVAVLVTVRLAAIERVVRGGLLVLPRGLAVIPDRTVEPLVVVGVDGCCGVDILGRSVSRIGGRQRSLLLGPMTPHGLLVARISSVSGLAALEAREPLVLGNLLLLPSRGETGAGNVGLDRRHKGGQAFAVGLSLLQLLRLQPFLPVCQPGIVILALIEVDVQTPANHTEPLIFQSVELLDGNAAHFGPGLVLESVVIQKLASKQQSDGQHAPDLTLVMSSLAGSLHHVDTLGKVVHAEKDRSAGKSSRSEDLRHELPESGVDGTLRHDDSSGHLGNIVGHQLDLVVENSANTSGHFGGGVVERPRLSEVEVRDG